jgi:hypothetical protein
MRAAIERHAPDTWYLVVPAVLAILAVIAYFLGSAGTAVSVALLAYATSAFGSLVKT